jgi:hypothetical protein
MIFIALLGAYSVSAVGVTGGPNHGEHPFIVTLVHLGAFAWRGPALPELSNHAYWGSLLVALALSIVALWLTANTNSPRGWPVLLRVGLGLCYATLFGLLLVRPA